MSSMTPRGVTVPRQFRLREDTLADLDWIAAQLSRETGFEVSRTDAIRYAARTLRADREKKLRKKAKAT